ncbi:uncharacterized protein BP01DRAFT_387000 [Aspergillus saccharolyticus JOP 1030-1]|uniref:Uncharacterized protein n=1 Tax=Aspergillus saccharolyticus JOP 1030-1 TaxID=1450539 RepID=A0A318Z1C3_9EURO|nr:hypothetical protein BP01DRAFT_387000 [Aspergillus saccharolyticus JOP 1030-1]PYH40796.1 hypothetical protein BP01DRAFT_387000 [Aspergillus saccharolyticus JOP 1030-1]
MAITVHYQFGPSCRSVANRTSVDKISYAGGGPDGACSQGVRAYSRLIDRVKASFEGVKGMTRQLGNFSFTRVYQAGREVPAYQPLASLEIFRRANFSSGYSVRDAAGLRDTFEIRNEVPAVPKSRCYILAPGSCELEVWKTVLDGTAVVRNWHVVEDEDGDRDWEDAEDALSNGRKQVVLDGIG